eukprot:TRINITY_DN82_c0_g1_i2.p1 TRINITY_DN82_c0_g1~~TRINITY_DN82_c0_g1_i2.p1  ORF type:complete len:300 (+),score=109.26 TRINITY_DN82_c0_g1_i2:170-1069(+)
MGFAKVQKTNAYFKKFQTKKRRRRECKTDYYSRKRMITSDLNKYDSPKYRFVPRKTNTKIICQVIYATIIGDKVIAQASSVELKKYGLTTGLKNYPAAYCTGLLCARRLLEKVGMTKYYQAQKATGEYFSTADKPSTERKPFKAYLDIGLYRATKGNNIFGCLKGACDGGLNIPHSTKKFVGFKKTEDKETFDAKLHRERIFGVHIDKYMKQLKTASEEDYQSQFSIWDKCLKANKVTTVEALYTKIQNEIIKNPAFTKKEAKKNPKREHKKFRPAKLTGKQKIANRRKKVEIALKQQE